jgi:DNA-binding response OmpR family regulator
VLLVEDEPRLAVLLRRRLESAGFDVCVEHDGVSGLERLLRGEADVAVVDVMLPGLDGVALTRAARASGVDTRVLLLTARDTVADRVNGLDAGADDYLGKPFAFEELRARINALLRRASPGSEAHSVTCDHDLLELSPREFDLLECFLRNAGRALRRRELLEQVWAITFDADTTVVDTYVHYLRRKLGDAAKCLRTVRGVGYVWRPE